MQSFNIVNTPVILLFSKKWAPGLSAEDNSFDLQHTDFNVGLGSRSTLVGFSVSVTTLIPMQSVICNKHTLINQWKKNV